MHTHVNNNNQMVAHCVVLDHKAIGKKLYWPVPWMCSGDPPHICYSKQTNNSIGTQLSSPNQFPWNARELLDCHYLTCLVGGSESCKHLEYPWDQLPHQANLQLVQCLIFLSMICKQGSVRPLKDIAATSVFGNCLCTKINLMNIPQIC
jgi:hypothetical protein